MQRQAEARDTDVFYDDLRQGCIDNIKLSLNHETGLFDRQLRDGRWDSVIGTENTTSTAICLIGLDRAGVQPTSIGCDLQSTFAALYESVKRHAYSGAIGLVVWAGAVHGREMLTEVLAKMGTSAKDLITAIPSLTTMELGWLVSGLCHEVKRSAQEESSGLLAEAAKHLIGRYSDPLFVHATRQASLSDRLRKSIPNFADQIYAVQALSFYSILKGNEQALAIARRCMDRLIELQGPHGEWWWHYDARKGIVAQHYPVYSVHQHAMAPMTLMALACADKRCYSEAISLSQNWISDNGSALNMIDKEMHTVWRDQDTNDLQLLRLGKQFRSTIVVKETQAPVAGNVKLNRETRPYEWGWCLYAGAIATRADIGGHLA